MKALVLYASTVFMFNPLLCVLLLPLIGLQILGGQRETIRLDRTQRAGLALIMLSVLGACVMFILIGPKVANFSHSIIGEFPYIVLILAALLVGRFVSDRDLDVLAFLIACEILIGCVEFYAGVNSFFVATYGEVGFGETELLYYNRVYGLSSNSSGLAFKVLVAASILLLNFQRYGKWIRGLLGSLVIIGLFISFSRTTIVSVLLGAAWFFGSRIGIKGYLVVIAAIGVLLVMWLDMLKRQFFRGIEGIDLSGRDAIFNYFYQFLLDNLVTGNSGAKLWVYFGDRLYHAHNSYLELLASNGIIVSGCFLLGWLLLFSRSIRLAAAVLLYSVFQYGVFWGFVFHDIVIAAILFQYADRVRDRRNGRVAVTVATSGNGASPARMAVTGQLT